MSLDQLKRVARSQLIRAFSPKVLQDLMQFGESRRVDEARESLGQFGLISSEASLAEVFERAYSVLLRVYPGEYVLLNECLCREMAACSERVGIYRELAVGTSKADLAIFSAGESSGFEIKSRFDRLDRLRAQLESYQQVFTRTYVVTQQSHASKVLDQSPATVGVLSVSGEGIQTLRPATENPDLLCPNRQFALLRKPEYLQLIEAEFGAAPELPNTRIYRACLALFESIDPARAQALVSDILRRRQSRPPDDQDMSWRLPRSLRALVLSGKLDQAELLKLSTLMDEP